MLTNNTANLLYKLLPHFPVMSDGYPENLLGIYTLLHDHIVKFEKKATELSEQMLDELDAKKSDKKRKEIEKLAAIKLNINIPTSKKSFIADALKRIQISDRFTQLTAAEVIKGKFGLETFIELCEEFKVKY